MCALMAEKRCETPACPGHILKRCDDCASVFCIVCEDGDHLNPCSSVRRPPARIAGACVFVLVATRVLRGLSVRYALRRVL